MEAGTQREGATYSVGPHAGLDDVVAPNPTSPVVWMPRTIAPVREEMDLEESLSRRFAAHPPGTGYVSYPDRSGRREPSLRRCATCDEPLRWGTKRCLPCELKLEDEAPASAPGPEDDDATRSSFVQMVFLAIGAVIGVAVFSWAMGLQPKDDAQKRELSCPTVPVGSGMFDDC